MSCEEVRSVFVTRGKGFFVVKSRAVLLLLIFFMGGVLAIPQTFNVHGKLSDSGGDLTGTYSMNFSLYDSYGGGSVLWTEVYSVTTDEGVYNVILQNVDLPFSAQYYLGINVEGDGEMTPRMNLTSSAYAFESDNFDGYNSDYFMPLNTSVYGSFDFNGGWGNGGFSIVDGDIYAQTGWFYNISSLQVSELEINGSIFPDLDDSFDVGSSSLRWKDLYLSGEVFSDGVGDSYFMGNIGIGVAVPTYELDVAGSARIGDDSVGVLYLAGGASGSGQVIFQDSGVSQARIGVPNGQTYLSLSGTDTLTADMVIDSDGNVGIGTVSPEARLEIDEATAFSLTTSDNDTLFLDSSGGAATLDSYGASIGFSKSNGGLRSAAIVYVQTSADSNQGGLAFLTHPASTSIGTVVEQMRITHDGNVGIGTESPVTKLHVNGSVNVTSGNDFCIDGSGTCLSTVSGGSSLWTNSSGDATFTTGNVGIGTDSPGEILSITANSDTGAPTLRIDDTDTTVGSKTPDILFSSSGTQIYRIRATDLGGLVFRGADNLNDMVIDTSGNVGIGTSTPSEELHLANTATVRMILQDTDVDASGEHWAIENNAGEFAIQQSTDGTGAWNSVVDRIHIDADGDVGIGTDGPSYPLHVSGDAYVTSNLGVGSIPSAGIAIEGNIGLTNTNNQYGVVAEAFTATTATNTHYAFGGAFKGRSAVSSGIVNSGYVMGIDVSGYLSGAGDLTGVYGARIDAGTYSGGTGTVANTYGARVRLLNAGSGVMTNAYGLHVSSTDYSGTISNVYGLYIADLEGVNDYGVYQVGAGDVNYFAGDVGIGTDSPGAKLDVYDSAPISRISDSRTGTWDYEDTFGKLEFWSEDTIDAPGIQAYIRAIHLRSGTGHSYADAGLEFGVGSAAVASTKMVLTNAGNVGIGISDPEDTLVVASDAGGGTVRLVGRASDNISSLTFTDNGRLVSSYFQGDGSWFRARADSGFHFAIGSTPDITTNTFTFEGGSVGIGETNPGRTLEVVSQSGTAVAYFKTGANDASSAFLIRNSDSVDLFDLDADGDLYIRGDVGIGVAAPISKLHLIESDTVANTATTAMFLNHDMSGSDVLTGDRSHVGLSIDIDSSASGGDITNEHRVYGMMSNVLVTGDSDAVYAAYNLARTAHSSGTITNVAGSYNYGQGDNSAATTTNVYGTQSLAYEEGTGTRTNMYGAYSKILKQATATGVTTTQNGIYSEIESDNGAGAITTGYAVRAEIDNDNTGLGASAWGTTYLYYGNYAGTLPTNSYGVYIIDAVDNYFAGSVGIGTNSPGSELEVNGDVTAVAYYYSSDESLKENIVTIGNPIDKIKALRGVYFNWKKDGKKDVGFIAQEIEDVLPELVATNDDTGLKSVEYANIVAVAVEAIKEQQTLIEIQQKQIEDLKKRLVALENE